MPSSLGRRPILPLPTRSVVVEHIPGVVDEEDVLGVCESDPVLQGSDRLL